MTSDPEDQTKKKQENLLDEAIEESFPASDPISPGVGPGEPIDNHTPSADDKTPAEPK